MPDLDRKLIEILEILANSKEPVGAKVIARELNKKGYKIGERAVRYHLKILDSLGLTKKLGYSGRIITEKGLEELEKANISYRLGSIYSNILEKTISSNYRFGYVVINRAKIYADFDVAVETIRKVFSAGLVVGNRVGLIDRGNYSEILTLCSLNFDNILLQNGIMPIHICGGIVKFEDNQPVEFKEIIEYKSTSIDPLLAFLEKKETDVLGVIENGEGYVPANFRVIAKEYLPKFEEILKLEDLKCVISYGEENVLGLDIGNDYIGIALIGGLTPIAPFIEMGYYYEIVPMSSIVRLESLTKFKKENREIINKKSKIRIKNSLSKMLNLITKVDFDIDEDVGNVIANVGYTDKKYYNDVLELLKEAYKKNLGIGDRLKVVEEKDKLKIYTICALTLDGIFINNSIPILPKYGGVIECLEDKKRFINIIGYSGSSLDPHEIFFNMVDCETTFLAGFRETHRISREKLDFVLKKLKWNGVLDIGEPNNELYGINVGKDMFGIVYLGGINPLSWLNEHEIPIEIKAMKEVVRYEELIDYREL
ncbi:NrpR regulatory domain-containing protein [Methanocaldococcus indicus]|uniref:DUF128 domain-containing protein n=1 Tax=Methanocaldococcus indicus TaxID=213231 RepID=UPI003C6D3838